MYIKIKLKLWPTSVDDSEDKYITIMHSLVIAYTFVFIDSTNDIITVTDCQM